MDLDERFSVGLVYNLPLHSFIEAHPALVEVVEIEPQTLWFRHEHGYSIDLPRLRRVAALAPRTTVHGVGFPVGTARPRYAAVRALFEECVRLVGAPWASEHLSFNQAMHAGAPREAGFLLPPCPYAAGVDAAIAAIREVQRTLPVPFAVENGVSYLRPRPGELPDGEWLRAVLEGSDASLVLDLHNAWCNHLNGRQSIERFLASLPLERVIELHLAGGEELAGYRLDAHSGPVPDALMALTRELLPSLPGLRAVLFEITPSAVEGLGEAGLRAQLEALHALRAAPERPGPRAPAPEPARRGEAVARDWEDGLLQDIVGPPRPGEDPGLALYRELIREFRLSNISGTLPFSTRYLLLSQGQQGFDRLAAPFLASSAPEPFGPVEAGAFAARLAATLPGDAVLATLLDYEQALCQALTRQETRRVEAPIALLPLLLALASNELPPTPPAPTHAIVSPEGVDWYDGDGALLARAAW